MAAPVNMQESYQKLNKNKDENENIEESAHVVHNKLGTINGCYVPCLLNIMGVILFERLGWGVGQIGVSGVLLLFLIAEFQAIITVLSLSAIVTNGNMRGGGSYYMISRTLGPEFGGSIGLLFYAAYCVGVAFYCTGFAEEVVNTFYSDVTDKKWLTIMFASIVCAFCLIIALLGAKWFTKVNVFLFLLQFSAIMTSLLACFFRGTFSLKGESEVCDEETDELYKHYAWSWTQLSDMWSFACSTSCVSFQTAFGVLFPAVTGIMEGANLSGDLANPTYSIPVGTLSAIASSMLVYLLLIFSFAGSFNQCTLRNDTTIMQQAAWNHAGTPLVITGIMISASGAALGSVFGGSRVLQAIARDKLFPYTNWFEYGSPKGDEPRVAVIFTWIIAQSLIFIGSINAIAPIGTSFFCLSYCTVNFSCFLLEISGTPNFRPSFTYYTWHTCLLGTISNLVVMFFVDYRFASAALICEIVVFIFLVYRAPQNVWGDVTQSIIFHQVRKYLLRLDSRKAHSKTWRPSILLLADSEELALIDLCNNLKKGGLYIIGTTIIGDFSDKVQIIQTIKNEWIEFIDRNSLKAFPQIQVSNTLRSGYESLILLSGLGAMEPNIIVLPMLRLKSSEHQREHQKYVKLIKENGGRDQVEEEDEKEEKKEDTKNSEIEIDEKHDDEDMYRIEDDEYYLPKRASVALKSLKSLVALSPAEMDPVEYMTLLRNILKFNRNIVMTANIHSLDFELLVSQNIATSVIEKRKTDNNNVYRAPLMVGCEGNLQIDSVESMQESQTTVNSNSTTTHWKLTSHQTPNIRGKWVDIWLFADDYTFDLNDTSKDNGFPYLIMQISHILLQNKLWDRVTKLRVFLFVDSTWNEQDQSNLDEIVKNLRLQIDQIIIINKPTIKKPSWHSIISNKMKKKDLKKYYFTLNSTMISLSSQTYFTFLKLPLLPPEHDNDEINNNKLCKMYFESLYILLQHMPPTALIATGQQLPVISIDI